MVRPAASKYGSSCSCAAIPMQPPSRACPPLCTRSSARSETSRDGCMRVLTDRGVRRGKWCASSAVPTRGCRACLRSSMGGRSCARQPATTSDVFCRCEDGQPGRYRHARKRSVVGVHVSNREQQQERGGPEAYLSGHILDRFSRRFLHDSRLSVTTRSVQTRLRGTRCEPAGSAYINLPLLCSSRRKQTVLSTPAIGHTAFDVCTFEMSDNRVSRGPWRVRKPSCPRRANPGLGCEEYSRAT